MKDNFTSNLSKLLSWMISYWFNSVPNAHVSATKFVHIINKLIANHGLYYTIKQLKAMRLIVTKYMAGEPIRNISDRVSIKKSGFPNRINFLRGYIDSGKTDQIRFVLTLLGASRAIRYDQNEPNFSPLIDPQIQNENIINGLVGFIPQFIKMFKIPKFVGNWSRRDCHLSTKSSPQGFATLTAWRAAFLLPDWLVNNIGVFGGIDLYNFINDIRKHRNAVFLHKIFKKLGFKEFKGLRKISIVRDPEAKARIIAILDWFSQEALRGFHNHIFDVLRTLPQDRTFTQNPIISNKRPSERFHSLDLSNATDRFPINIQQKVVEELTDEGRAIAWRGILTWLPFTTPKGDKIHYEIGQPMGAYSSWAVFTLTHHLVVQYAAKIAGENLPFCEYILLGDDIVIYNDRVSELYKLIIKGIGADFSEMKSHTSPYCYEFAKRWFRNGIEVTGIPVTGFMENLNSYIIIYRNIVTLFERGIHTTVAVTIPNLVLSFLKDVTCTYTKTVGIGKSKTSKVIYYNKKFLKNLYNRVSGLHAFHLYVHQGQTDTLRNYLNLGLTNKDWTLPMGEEFNKFLLSLVRQSVDGILDDNTNRLMGYTSSIFSTLGVIPRNSSWEIDTNINNPGPDGSSGDIALFLPDLDTFPLIYAIYSKMDITCKMLKASEGMTNLKEIIKVCDFEDPERVSNQRACNRLIGTESRIIKRMFNTLDFMTRGGYFHPSTTSYRSMIANQQMMELSTLIDTTKPDRPLRGYVTSALNFPVPIFVKLDESLKPLQEQLRVKTK